MRCDFLRGPSSGDAYVKRMLTSGVFGGFHFNLHDNNNAGWDQSAPVARRGRDIWLLNEAQRTERVPVRLVRHDCVCLPTSENLPRGLVVTCHKAHLKVTGGTSLPCLELTIADLVAGFN